MPRVDELLDYLAGRRPACSGCGARDRHRHEVEPGGGWWCDECIALLSMFGRRHFAGPVPEPTRPRSAGAGHFALVPGCSCGSCVRWRRARV